MQNYGPPPIKKKVDLTAILAGCGALGMGFLCVAIGLGLYWILQSYQDNTQSVETATAPIIVLATPQTTQQDVAEQVMAQPTDIPAAVSTVAPITNTPLPTTLPPTAVPIATARPVATASPLPSPTTPNQQPSVQLNVPIDVMQQPISDQARADLGRMWSADFEAYDYYDVVQRMEYTEVGSRTITRAPFNVGDRFEFILDDRIISARLGVATANAYLWVEEGMVYDDNKLQEVANRLENEFYPRMTQLFGKEWSPGVDNDPHFSILHFFDADGYTELGFFDSLNEYPKTVDENSNEQEMLFMNMSQLELADELYYGTLVHELQHLIHWNLDHNETVWLDEGLAQLSELYAGLQTVESADYLADTSLQLNSWSNEGDRVHAHYGASYLFASYLWEQLGDDAIRDLTGARTNGLTSVRQVLSKYRPNSTLEQFLGDWAVANLLDFPENDPRYGYQSFLVGLPNMQEKVLNVPHTSENELSQYGVHYIDLAAVGSYTVSFAGDTLAEMIPTTPPEGSRVWFAPAINDSSVRLTTQLDLRTTNKATLLFSVWYDLEQDFDYAYVEISADNGRTWDVLEPENDSLGYYGPAFTGSSTDNPEHVNGWLEEAILLDDYVGREVLLRFEVLTDSAVSGFGFALDDINIPEINFYDGAEFENGLWVAEGFVPTGPQLPQQWALQFVQNDVVTPITLDAFNRAQFPVTIGSEGGTLIIMPQVPYITVPAYYWLQITP